MIQPPNQQNQQAPHPGFWRRNLIWIILLVVPLVVPCGIFLFWQANSTSSGAEPVSYSLFINEVKDHNVTSVTLTDNSVTGTFKNAVASDQTHANGTNFTTTIPNLHSEGTVPILRTYGVKINVDNDNGNNLLLTFLVLWGPLLLLAVPMYLFLLGCLALYFYRRPRPPADRAPA